MSAQMTSTAPIAKKLCIVVDSTFLRADHAAVERGESRRHEQHQRCRHEHPRGVAGVELRHRSSLSCVLSACDAAHPLSVAA